MKKSFVLLTVLCGVLVFAPAAWSLTMSDVGGVDDLIAWDTVNSGAGSTSTWVNDTLDSLGFGTGWTVSADLSGTWAQLIDSDPGVVAFSLPNEPAFFLVKTGGGNGMESSLPGNPDTFLFQNLDFTTWGVIDLAEMQMGNYEVGVISHIRETGTTQVPEPGTLLLLGSGLVGVAVLRKKFRG